MEAVSATPEYQSATTRPWKETLILAFVFLLVFSPFQAIQNLQSSVNQLHGLGVSSLACLYGSMFLVSFFTPTIVYHLGVKVTIIIAWIGHILYLVCNFYPSWITLIPGSVMLGLISCPLWTSAETYLSSLSRKAVELRLNQKSKKANTLHAAFSRLGGVFSSIFTVSQLIGNLVSSIVISQSSHNETEVTQSVKYCGALYCPGEGEGKPLLRPEPRIMYILLGVFLVSDVLGLIVTSRFLPNLVQPQYTGREICRKLKSYWVAFRQPKLWMLVPLFASRGMIFTLHIGLFTEAYVSCALGIHYVGYVMSLWGLTTMVSSAFLGYAARFTGRQFLCGFAFVVDTAILVAMLLWHPQSDYLAAFLCLSVLMGIVDGIWTVQINALVAVMFPAIVDSAFAVRGTWVSLTVSSSWLAANYLCPGTRIYIAFGLLAAGLLGYIAVEVTHRRNLKSFDRDEHEYILLSTNGQQGDIEDDDVMREGEGTEETLFDARVERRVVGGSRSGRGESRRHAASARGRDDASKSSHGRKGKIGGTLALKDDDDDLETFCDATSAENVANGSVA